MMNSTEDPGVPLIGSSICLPGGFVTGVSSPPFGRLFGYIAAGEKGGVPANLGACWIFWRRCRTLGAGLQVTTATATSAVEGQRATPDSLDLAFCQWVPWDSNPQPTG